MNDEQRPANWTGACSGCPHAIHCADDRKRAKDATGVGRHTSCEHYQAFERFGPGRPWARSSRLGWNFAVGAWFR